MGDGVFLLFIVLMVCVAMARFNELIDFHGSALVSYSISIVLQFHSMHSKILFAVFDCTCSQLPHSKLLIVTRKVYTIPNISPAARCASVKSSPCIKPCK